MWVELDKHGMGVADDGIILAFADESPHPTHPTTLPACSDPLALHCLLFV